MAYQRRGSESDVQQLQRRIFWTQTAGNLEESVINSEVVPVPSSLVESIVPIFRAANEIEPMNPRVAYVCRFYAFEVAHRLDPTCKGRGVRQFKTALLRRLERENETTSITRGRSNDALELKSVYEHYNMKYIEALQNIAKKYTKTLQNAGDKADRDRLTKADQTVAVLFEMLKD